MTHTQSHQVEPVIPFATPGLAAQVADLREAFAVGGPKSAVFRDLLLELLEADDEPTNSPDLLASFRAYVRAAEEAHRAHATYRSQPGPRRLLALTEANAAERTAREAHETALREVGER